VVLVEPHLPRRHPPRPQHRLAEVAWPLLHRPRRPRAASVAVRALATSSSAVASVLTRHWSSINAVSASSTASRACHPTRGPRGRAGHRRSLRASNLRPSVCAAAVRRATRALGPVALVPSDSRTTRTELASLLPARSVRLRPPPAAISRGRSAPQGGAAMAQGGGRHMGEASRTPSRRRRGRADSG